MLNMNSIFDDKHETMGIVSDGHISPREHKS